MNAYFRYIEEISVFPLLSAKDEVRLARIIEEGQRAESLLSSGSLSEISKDGAEWLIAIERGRIARQEFINSNLRLVVSIASKIPARGFPLLDRIQEGNTGLIRAVEKFDWRKGFKFSTYATWWIRQAINRGIGNSGRVIRLPIHVMEDINAIRRCEASLVERNRRQPELVDIAIALNSSRLKIRRLICLAEPTMTFSELEDLEGDIQTSDDGYPEETSSIEDALWGASHDNGASLDEVLDAMEADWLHKHLAKLSPRQLEVICFRFGIIDIEMSNPTPCRSSRKSDCSICSMPGKPQTLESIGEHLNLTRERVRQIEKQTIGLLGELVAATAVRDLLAV